MKKQKCTLCNETIYGEVAYLNTKPYHCACLKRHKIREHQKELEKKAEKSLKNRKIKYGF